LHGGIQAIVGGLTFDVTVGDGVLSGHSRAGRLARTEVNGTRRAD
jgi:hypothetical protein